VFWISGEILANPEESSSFLNELLEKI